MFRIFAATFGRPLLIHNELTHVEMPLDVEVDDLPKDRPQYQVSMNPETVPSSCIIFTPSM